MGMPVTVHVVDDHVREEALDAVYADFTLLDRTFSPYRPDSAVSRINSGELRLEDAGRLITQAAGLCRLYERATDGYFSAWIDGRFDPSGLVKGWAIDRACSILDGNGYKDYIVDAGGDVADSRPEPPAGPMASRDKTSKPSRQGCAGGPGQWLGRGHVGHI